MPRQGPWELAGLSSSGLCERDDEPDDVLSRYRPEHQRHSQDRAHRHARTTLSPALMLRDGAAALPEFWGKPQGG